MRYKRVIPCLDIRNGRVVKGTKFNDLRDMGEPVALAAQYAAAGADELVLLRISADEEDDAGSLSLIAQVAAAVRGAEVPLTVGGGIRSVADAERVLAAGASRVAVSSAAVTRPQLLAELTAAFGGERIVLAVDARKTDDGWEVVTGGGRRPTGIDALAWCQDGERRNVGELLLTSIDQDGTGSGYDLALLRSVAAAVRIPVIASGGAGGPHDLVAAAQAGADAVLAASIFHQGKTTIGQVKRLLRSAELPVRFTDNPLAWISEIRFGSDGLVPVVVEGPDGVRMLGYADAEALRRTVQTRFVWFYSRSRGRHWLKGEESGNRLRVISIDLDCDRDAVRIEAEPEGPTCHTGATSCFFDRVWSATGDDAGGHLPTVVAELIDRIVDRLRERPAGSYVVRLADDPEYALRKVGEEAVELIVAAGPEDLTDAQRMTAVVGEAADLLFHWLVMLHVKGIPLAAVAKELRRRAKPR